LQTAEHIVLESETPRELPKASAPRRIHATLQCASRLRRRALNLAIIDYHYLAVSLRRGKDTSDYVLDLRFIDPSLALTRNIPWRWILSAFVLTALTVLSFRSASILAMGPLQHFMPRIAATLCAASVCAYLVVAVLLFETVAFHSIHGRATLVEYTAGPGMLRAARPFMRKLAAHIQLAAQSRRLTKAEQLRDELRDHHRLMEEGVLSAEVYDASKASILAQHASLRRKR
jgi:hypothetical protein